VLGRRSTRRETELEGQLRLAWERMDQLEDRLEELGGMIHRLTRADDDPNGPHAEWTIARIYRTYPGAQEVLARHHLGGCGSCAVAEEETLRQGAALHQVDLEDLLADLRALAPSDGS